MNIICLDIETTGVNLKEDEVLQFAIIDGNENVLFNSDFKPTRYKSWEEAESIHHISPSDVRSQPSLFKHKSTIEKILKSADVIVGYNILRFDLPMLFANGISNTIRKDAVVVDVMLAYAEVKGVYDGYHKHYKWWKLGECACAYNYIADGEWHNSLADAKATLYCFYKIFGDVPSIPETGYGIDRTFGEQKKPLRRYTQKQIKRRKRLSRFLIIFGILFIIACIAEFTASMLLLGIVFLALGIYIKYRLSENEKRGI